MSLKVDDRCRCAACDGSPWPHWSDCAVHNEPAYPNGPCSCGCEAFIDAFQEFRCGERGDWFVVGGGKSRRSCDKHVAHFLGWDAPNDVRAVDMPAVAGGDR